MLSETFYTKVRDKYGSLGGMYTYWFNYDFDLCLYKYLHIIEINFKNFRELGCVRIISPLNPLIYW